MTSNQSRSIESVRQLTTSNINYNQTNLGIKSYDEGTKNIISSTFGVIKNNIMAFWYAVGLDPNVTNIYTQTMMDPNQAMNFGDKIYFPHPGVGNMHPYNDVGRPSDGCFQFHTMG